MILTSIKASVLWVTSGTAAVVLYVWALGSRQPVRVTSKETRFHFPMDAATSRLPAMGLLHDANDSPANAHPQATPIDEALGRLEEGIRHAAQITDDDERRRVLTGACLGWADFDPADALRLARALGLDQRSHAVLEEIVQKWAETDFMAAMAWTDREPAGEQRDLLLARVVFARSKTQPGEAAILAIMRISPGHTQTETIIAVLHQWALRDFSGAQAWTNRLPLDLQARAYAELAGVARHRLAHDGGSPR